MAILEEKSYLLQCDECGDYHSDEYMEFIFYPEEDVLIATALSNGWFRYSDKWFCPSCYKLSLQEI